MIQNNISPIVIVLGAVLVVAVSLIVYLFWRTRHIESDCELLMRDGQGQNFAQIVSDNIAQGDEMLRAVERLSEQYAQVLRRMAGAVQHVGVVRFDAFRDLGGMLSFAVALLDDRGNGLVFSSIYGRTESRTYAKPVVERSSSYELSPEEREAIRLAMQSKELGALPVEARDRDHEERMANLRLFHDRDYLQRSNQVEARDQARLEEARRVGPAQERRAPRRSGAAREEIPHEPAPQERTPDEPASRRAQKRQSGAPQAESAGSRPGRANHVGPPEEREPLPVEEPPQPSGRPVDLIAELVDEPFEEPTEKPSRASRRRERAAEGAPVEEEEASRPAARRARGLNTPVERLRDREPRGE